MYCTASTSRIRRRYRVTIFAILSSATFDYEEQREYTDLSLIVEDNGIINKRRSEPIPITVRIVNLNDEPTVFDQPIYSELNYDKINYIHHEEYSAKPIQKHVQILPPEKTL